MPILIKARRVEHTGQPGHWFMGHGSMVQIGLITARNLLDGAAPPRIGHESDVRVTRDEHDLPRALTIFNISGDYILGSAQVPIEQWGDVFGVQLDKLTELRHVDCEPDQDGEVTAGERQRG